MSGCNPPLLYPYRVWFFVSPAAGQPWAGEANVELWPLPESNRAGGLDK